MAVDLAANDAAVTRVDDRAKILPPTSQAAVCANLLSAEVAAHTHDTQARSDDFRVLKRAKELHRQVSAIRLRQTQAFEAQRFVELELAQATAS